jgi:hypothetical protein
MEKPKLCDIVEIIRPFCKFTKQQLAENELQNKARYIMRSFRDEKKVRTYFLDNNGVYINAEKSTDLADLDKADRQLSVKYSGLAAAIEKVRNRIDGVIEKFKRR